MDALLKDITEVCADKRRLQRFVPKDRACNFVRTNVHVKVLSYNPCDRYIVEMVDGEHGKGEYVNEVSAAQGYRGEHAPPEYRVKIFVTGQWRNISGAVKKAAEAAQRY